jgi:hypothetical protein
VLPEAIRRLSRRHAASLRDETWDADVDRLVGTLRGAIGETVPPAPPLRRRAASSLKWGVLAAAVLAAMLLARTFRGGDTDSDTTSPVPGTTTVPTDSGGAPVGAAGDAIAIPRLAEIAHGSVIYTLLSGSVAPRGSARTVRLRFRVSNEGAYPVNFWDASFRLATGGQVFEPTSGLNEIVAGNATRQGIVTFDVPADVREVVLRVLGANTPAELPLDLRSTGFPSSVDTADTGDTLSRADVVQLVRDARTLGSGNEVEYALVSATARRFVNTRRVVANLRITNRGGYPLLFGADTLRLLADGQATAPFETPNEVVAPGATAAGAFVFDVPAATRRAVLRVTGEAAADVPLDLP